MRYRRLGRSGLQLSEFGLGSWVTFGKQVQLESAKNIMAKAYDEGVNFFDNAEEYESGESERVMGRALSDLSWSRDSFVVSSKVFWGGKNPTQRGLSRKHVFDACHAALKRLRVDYLDLYYCHRPDIDTPVAETVRAMHDLVSQGKVMYWGTSEWNAQQITEAWQVAKSEHLIGPTMEQPEYSMLVRDKVEGDFRSIYDTYGLGITSFSPLSSGLLTGKYLEGIPEDSRLNLPGYEWLRTHILGREEKMQVIEELADIAKELDMPLHHLALRWCLSNSRVSSVILGVSSMAQLDNNLEVMNNLRDLDAEMLERIDQVLGNKPEPRQRF